MSDKNVTLYALTTCVHCRHTKDYLEEHCVPFNCVYVDTLQGDERKNALDDVRKHNPRVSFPTMVVGCDGGVVVGFNKDKLKEALGI